MQQAVQNPTHIPHTLQLQRTIGNQATQRLLQRTGKSTKKKRSKTLYMGMNAEAEGEAKKLKGILRDDVLLAMNDPKLEKSLKTDEGIGKWVATEMPLLLNDFVQFAFVYITIQSTTPAARDQMAQVMKMFYAAEYGEYKLERLVMSGHSNGVELWGDEATDFQPGKLFLEPDLTHLTTTFPVAAAQVEDVMFSACQTAGSIKLVVELFPNVRTVWGYAGQSPKAGGVAEAHIAQWEGATKGNQTLQRDDGMGVVSLWTREAAKKKKGNGFIRNDPAKVELQELLDNFSSFQDRLIDMVNGDKTLDQTTLNTAYNYAHSLLAHPLFENHSDRPMIEKWRDVLLRLRFYSVVCEKFNTNYATQIKEGYDAIGRTIPNFNRGRAKLKTEMAEFKKALKATPNSIAQAFYDTYLVGLWELKPDIIKTEWI